MSKVAIITDSTTALPQELVNSLPITVIPLSVYWEGKTYLDGIDIQPDEFYQKLSQSKSMPSTSQPSAAAFAEAYQDLLTQGFDILALLISSKISGTCDSAQQASLEFPNENIVIVDSLQASMPLALVAILTAEAAQKGATLLECTNLAKDLFNRVRTLFIVETLEFLHKGGRIGSAAKFLGTALNLKPILELSDGVISPLDKVRTTKKAISKAFEIAESELGKQGSIDYLGIVSANEDQLAEEMRKLAHQRFRVKRELIGSISPVIGSHVGPGTLALVYIPAKK